MALNGGITMIDKLTTSKEIIAKIIADYDLKEDEIKITDIKEWIAKDTGNINNKSAISDCLRGRRKTAYGSKWRYYND